jgi:hypothetical protein
LVVEEGADYYVQYGLMSEHHKSDLVWFKGNNAQTYFYQSELPYAQFDTSKFGYLVAPSVTAHKAIGIGVYSIFTSFPLDTSKPNYESAISCPVESEISVTDLIAMEFHYPNGFGHALTTGSDFRGATSTWGKINFVTYSSDETNHSVAHNTPIRPSAEGKGEMAIGVPWPFSKFCNAPFKVDA